MARFHSSHKSHSVDTQIPLMIMFTFFGIVALLVLFKCRRNYRNRKQYEAIELDGSKAALQIDRKKDTIKRHIDRLQSQLSRRKNEYQALDQLNEIVTARQKTSREEKQQENDEWEAMMARGRQIYGEAWEKSQNGSLPLSVLMTTNKEELMKAREEAKAKETLQAETTKTKKSRRNDNREGNINFIDRNNYAMLLKKEIISKEDEFKQGLQRSNALVVPHQTQWTTYRKAGQKTKQTSEQQEFGDDDVDIEWNSQEKSQKYIVSKSTLQLPKLDFSKLVSPLDLGTISPEETNPTLVELSYSDDEKAKALSIAASKRRLKIQALVNQTQ